MLELDRLHKRYGDVAALDGLSLAARRGRIVGFLGPNGSGKTTAMRAVFGLVGLDSGSVRWDGEAVGTAAWMRFGYMPEQRGLYPRMAVGAQLVFLGRLRGLGATEARAAADHWLDYLGLADRSADAVSALSHGNQQRVQLAAALVHDPELLVLDEPFSGLDPIGVEAMSAVLRERAERGASVLFSSHQLDLVEELCDDVVIIASGRDRVAGTLDEVRSASAYRRVEARLQGGRPVVPPPGSQAMGERAGLTRLRVPVDTTARDVLDHLEAQGTVERFVLEPPALSEVFRDVVGASVAEFEQRERKVTA